MTPEVTRKQNNRRWALWVALAIPVAAAVIYLLVWYGPDVIARHDIGSVTGPLRVFRMQQARDAARGRLLTLGAGLFAAAALIFTARNSIFLQRTVQLTEQGQVTDRYTKAIEQLGSEKLDVRIGGVYALERRARFAPGPPHGDGSLAAFVRENSREPLRPASSAESGDDQNQPITTRPDVQAAVTVIGRRNREHDRRPLRLTGANLHGANLADADLTGAHLNGANLTRADLRAAILRTANLTDAILPGAKLTYAHLTAANLTAANLTGADLTQAILTAAELLHADLRGAFLPSADLTRADLTHANLTAAKLTHAFFTGADLTGAI